MSGKLMMKEILKAGDANAMKRIALARHACKKFIPNKPVDKAIINEILAYTMRAPTSLNCQSYMCIVATTEEAKKKMAQGVMDMNRPRILDSSFSVAWFGDLEITKRATDCQELLNSTGAPKELVDYVPAFLESLGNDWNNPQGYAFKNLSLAAQQFMLMCTSYGLATCPMDGVVDGDMKAQFDVPDRYKLAMVIPVGYQEAESRVTIRFKPETLFFENSLSNPMKDIKSIDQKNWEEFKQATQ